MRMLIAALALGTVAATTTGCTALVIGFSFLQALLLYTLTGCVVTLGFAALSLLDCPIRSESRRDDQ
ncbi:MAG: hypothetical protein JXJ18_10230 [Rhodobacteraceae bacterium]|nr:hypothetical protein [Paracoccaceae bacterium]